MSGREEPRAVINGLSGRSFHKDSTGISKILLFSAVISIGFERERDSEIPCDHKIRH